MIDKNNLIYLCALTKEWDEKIKCTKVVANHCIGKSKERIILWPQSVDSSTINPKNFDELKKHYKLEEIVFIDRLIGINKVVSIINHVNRSGQNFLRSKTPFNKYPQFPDMSKIYNKISGLDTVVVHTVGEKRFQRPPTEENVIWSELVGLIAPVAHYVGIKVFAIGGNNFDNIKQYIWNI